MRKKTNVNKLVLIIVLSIIGIVILNQLGLFKLPFVTTDLGIGQQETGRTQNNIAYICPSWASECSVKGVMECNIQKGTQVCSECTTDKNSLMLNPYRYTTSEIQMCPSGTCGIVNCFKGCRGGTLYECSGNFKHTSASGSMLLNKDLYYSDTIAGKTSFQDILKTGEKASIIGGDNNYIEYTSVFYSECDYNICTTDKTGWYDCIDHRKGSVFHKCNMGEVCSGGITSDAICSVIPTCSIDYCNNELTGFYKCFNGQQGSLTLCDTTNGFFCKASSSGSECQPPFTIKELKPSKEGFDTNEQVIIKVTLYSQEYNINSGNVKINVFDKPNSLSPIATYNIDNFNFKSNTARELQITNPTIPGKYYLSMEITYNGKTIKMPDNPYFRIAPTISNTVEIKGKNRPTPYIKNPVLVNVITPIQVDKVNLDLTFSNYPVTNIPQPTITQSGGFVIYSYEFTFLTAGTLEATASVEKSGVVSNSSFYRAEIKDLKIYSQFTNLLDCLPVGTSKTFNFETKVLDEYENTNNVLSITEPQAVSEKDISNTIKSISKGKYEFTYTFDKKGAYDIKLISSSPEYNVGSEPITPQIEVKDGCSLPECTTTQDCASKGTGYICSNNKCITEQPSYLWIFLLVGGIIFLIVIILLIKFYSNKNKSADIGIGGL